MKSMTRLRIGALIAASLVNLAAGAGAAAVPYTLEGYMGDAEGPKVFVIARVDPQGGKSTSWLRRGEAFEGYRVADYDAEAEALILLKGDERMILFLASTRMRSVENSPYISGSGEAPLPRERAIEWLRARGIDDLREAARNRETFCAYDPATADKWGIQIKEANEVLRKELERRTGMMVAVVEVDGRPFFIEVPPYEYYGPLRPLLGNLTPADIEQLNKERLIAKVEAWISHPAGWQRTAAAWIRRKRAENGLAAFEAIGPTN